MVLNRRNFRYLEEINNNLVDLLGSLIENDEVNLIEKEDEAEMDPNANIVNSSELRSHIIDINYDWCSKTMKCYSDSEIRNAGTFVQLASNSIILEENATDTIDFQTLNTNQNAAFNRIEAYYWSILEGHQTEPLRIIIIETTEIGKSYFIKAIRCLLHMMRLNQAFSKHNNEPFGGCSIIIFGDFGQLLLVFDLPIYANNSLQDQISSNSLKAYKYFREVYILNVIEYQSGESEEQQNFRNILMRLYNKKFILSNWEKLTVQLEDKFNRAEHNQFSEAIHILQKWSDVDKINIEKLISLNKINKPEISEQKNKSENRISETNNIAKLINDLSSETNLAAQELIRNIE
ncbi:20737_t:CDS:2, partial [Racocetra persica]